MNYKLLVSPEIIPDWIDWNVIKSDEFAESILVDTDGEVISLEVQLFDLPECVGGGKQWFPSLKTLGYDDCTTVDIVSGKELKTVGDAMIAVEEWLSKHHRKPMSVMGCERFSYDWFAYGRSDWWKIIDMPSARKSPCLM